MKPSWLYKPNSKEQPQKDLNRVYELDEVNIDHSIAVTQ